MSLKERVLHMVLFEGVALLLFVPLAMFATGEGAALMTGLSVTLSLIAMVWNFVYNWGFDAVFGYDRLSRTLMMRLAHGLLFEVGMICTSLPLLMYVLKEDFWTVLALDVGAIVFFLIYAVIFNWVYDVLRYRLRLAEQS
ncbi:PACE efflux transporter [Rhodovibrionaceae bacterium A322]